MSRRSVPRGSLMDSLGIFAGLGIEKDVTPTLELECPDHGSLRNAALLRECKAIGVVSAPSHVSIH